MIELGQFPALNAFLNATSAVLLTIGWLFIRRRNVAAHKACMIGAFAVSAVFLACYLYYHYHHGATSFPKQGVIRPIYFGILISHIILAVAMLPFIFLTFRWAFRNELARHVRIARWTLPIWLYVSVTGVVVYWLLYH